MGEWMPAFDRADYGAVAGFMLREAEIVAKAGAHFAVCPDNSAHLAFPHVIAKSPIPWLHIAEQVAKAAVHAGYKHAALLGTRFTMTGWVYPEIFTKYAVTITPPSLEDQQLVDRIIFQELVNGIFKEESRLTYNDVVARLKAQVCECVILGCTEIPLLVHADDCPLPTLDSTRLLARAAVDAALATRRARRVGFMTRKASSGKPS
jgi:aspartate racemase